MGLKVRTPFTVILYNTHQVTLGVFYLSQAVQSLNGNSFCGEMNRIHRSVERVIMGSDVKIFIFK